MKKIVLFAMMAFVSFSVFSQNATDSIPMKNGKVCISEVIQLENTSAATLYERAKIWVSKSFNSAKNVIQSDIPNSSLSIKAISTMPNAVEGGVLKGHTDFVLTIQFKDGRYKYELTDLVVNISDGDVESKIPYEKYTSMEQINKTMKKFELDSLLESLKKDMNVSDDW